MNRLPRRSARCFSTLALLLSGLLSGCAGGEETPACDRTPPLSYDNFGRGFMEKNCTGCHSSLLPLDQRNGAPPGVDLNTYAGVIDQMDRIEARSLGDNPTMPPGGGPSQADLEMLQEWLTCQVHPDAAKLEGGE